MAAGVTAAAVAAAVAAEVAEVPAKVLALAAMARGAGWAWAANMGLVVQAATRAEPEVAAAQRSARGTQGGLVHP
jgi:hypothetical protein